MEANYVKFLRGTPSAYAALTPKDPDTLYFITATDATVGKLYLGNILVASNVTADGTNLIDSLGELIDVNLQGLQSGQVLSYNGTEWVPMTLPEAVAGSVMIGASNDTAGTAGLVPAPKAGDQNKFLRGDGTWADAPGAADLSNYVTKDEFEVVDGRVDSVESSLTWGLI